jgi:hypothetical protein
VQKRKSVLSGKLNSIPNWKIPESSQNLNISINKKYMPSRKQCDMISDQVHFEILMMVNSDLRWNFQDAIVDSRHKLRQFWVGQSSKFRH